MENTIKNIVISYLNENRIIKKVYRGGSKLGTNIHKNATFYTDSEIEAKKYANYLHDNDRVFSKTIDFKNPLILVKSEIGYDKLQDELLKILGDENMIDVYEFPYALDIKKRIKIIEYARNNDFDGIVMDDSDITNRNKLRSYIEI